MSSCKKSSFVKQSGWMGKERISQDIVDIALEKSMILFRKKPDPDTFPQGQSFSYILFEGEPGKRPVDHIIAKLNYLETICSHHQSLQRCNFLISGITTIDNIFPRNSFGELPAISSSSQQVKEKYRFLTELHNLLNGYLDSLSRNLEPTVFKKLIHEGQDIPVSFINGFSLNNFTSAIDKLKQQQITISTSATADELRRLEEKIIPSFYKILKYSTIAINPLYYRDHWYMDWNHLVHNTTIAGNSIPPPTTFWGYLLPSDIGKGTYVITSGNFLAGLWCSAIEQQLSPLNPSDLKYKFFWLKTRIPLNSTCPPNNGLELKHLHSNLELNLNNAEIVAFGTYGSNYRNMTRYYVIISMGEQFFPPDTPLENLHQLTLVSNVKSLDNLKQPLFRYYVPDLMPSINTTSLNNKGYNPDLGFNYAQLFIQEGQPITLEEITVDSPSTTFAITPSLGMYFIPPPKQGAEPIDLNGPIYDSSGMVIGFNFQLSQYDDNQPDNIILPAIHIRDQLLEVKSDPTTDPTDKDIIDQILGKAKISALPAKPDPDKPDIGDPDTGTPGTGTPRPGEPDPGKLEPPKPKPPKPEPPKPEPPKPEPPKPEPHEDPDPPPRPSLDPTKPPAKRKPILTTDPPRKTVRRVKRTIDDEGCAIASSHKNSYSSNQIMFLWFLLITPLLISIFKLKTNRKKNRALN